MGRYIDMRSLSIIKRPKEYKNVLKNILNSQIST